MGARFLGVILKAFQGLDDALGGWDHDPSHLRGWSFAPSLELLAQDLKTLRGILGWMKDIFSGV
jgi:hypothetical protein